ncbi:MAG: glycosyltransferase [Rhodospirillaceae bacterium]|nr:glycosyltransferase [Rhodospirillaceae bacterium]
MIANNPVAQSAWSRAQGDPVSQPVDCAAITRRQIELFDPDILYFTDIVVFDSRFIRALKKRPTLVSGWRGFPSPNGTDWSEFDVVLTSFDRIMTEAEALGASASARFHPGFPEDCPVLTDSRNVQWDVVFSGTVTHQHTRRIAILDMIAQLSADPAGGFSFGLFMPDVSALPPHVQALNQGARWADDMLRTLRNARIVINVDVDAFGNQPPNMRLIEATGAGAFLMTPYHPELSNFFEPGVEVETFRTENELISKLLYYVDNPDKCDEIARNGQSRCLKDHGLRARTEWFKDILVGALNEKLTQS